MLVIKKERSLEPLQYRRQLVFVVFVVLVVFVVCPLALVVPPGVTAFVVFMFTMLAFVVSAFPCQMHA